jgi:hypothetical protein
MTRQWIPPACDLESIFLALFDAEASLVNSLFRPAWRAAPVPCISDEEMPKQSYTRQDVG